VNAITVTELKRHRDAGDDFLLLDVREPDEVATASIPWATVIPMMELPGRVGELPRDKPIYVLCHVGGRSAQVTQFLAQSGFPQAANVTGGIRAWSNEIDASVPQY
jgi:rhodanese-related sulfurtransferase